MENNVIPNLYLFVMEIIYNLYFFLFFQKTLDLTQKVLHTKKVFKKVAGREINYV